MTVSVRPPPRALRTVKVPDYTKQVRSIAVPRVVRPRPRAIRADPVLKGTSVQEWLGAECDSFQGMQTVRPQAWDIQSAADSICDARLFGEDHSLQVDVPVGAGRPDGALCAALRASAAQLVDPLAGLGLPASFTEQVRRDAEEIGVAVTKLIPAADKLSLKLELIREHFCVRWHQDNYVARAIVSYNCCGTEYIHDDHVDFWELNNCGNNDHVVRDRTPVLQAGVGDIFLIKGKLFPSGASGLVHRSPDQVYHPNGAIKTRFVLKVDVYTVQ